MAFFFQDLRIEPLYKNRIMLTPVWRTENFSLKYRIVPCCRFHMALAGQAHFSFLGNDYVLKPGKMLVIPPYISTKVWCDDFCDVCWAKFNVFYGGSTLDIFSLHYPPWEMDVPDVPLYEKLLLADVETLGDAALKRTLQQRVADRFIEEAKLRIILMPFLLAAEQSCEEGEDPGVFFQLLQYIDAHIEKHFTLKALSQEFHLHPTYLTNLFARRVGFPLIAYCNWRKLNRAEQLLGTTRMTVAEIAYFLGYSDPNNFSRLFKRFFGFSPQQYRKNRI